ncbi:RagB/SusD family nutrient uptake outer membrane protein [soil metagenome]
MTSLKRSCFPRGRAAAALLLTALLGGCDNSLLETPKTIIVADNLYTDAAGFDAGLNALYFQVRRERHGTNNDVNDLMATAWTSGVDNAYGLYLSPTERIFNEWGVRNNPQDGFINHIWGWLYQTINAANTIVDRAENPSVRWTPEEKTRVVAEARLIRAWSYRHLTYLFGPVPLNLAESTGENIRTDWERAPLDSVRKVMEADLLFAEQNLPALSPNPGKVTRAVAQHYLAELYLAMGEPARAEAKAQAVIGSGLYRLITQRYGVRASQPGIAFMDQFVDGNANRNQGNTEALWVLQYAANVQGGGASIMRRTWVTRYDANRGLMITAEYGGRGIGRLAITRFGLQLYEAQDQRGGPFAVRRFYLYNNPANLPAGRKLGDTLFTVVGPERVSNPLWPSTRKWDYADPNDITGAAQFGDQVYLRLAETYLLLAEAQFKQGKLAQAAEAINVVRRRAGASEITPAQVTLAFILDERSRELVTEEHRRYTLLRTGTWLDRTKRFNPLSGPPIVARDTLLPIPQSVIDANLSRPLPQNPGF